MVTALLSLVAIVWVAGLITLVKATRRAPVGIEDADGFHVVGETAPAASALGVAVSAS